MSRTDQALLMSEDFPATVSQAAVPDSGPLCLRFWTHM